MSNKIVPGIYRAVIDEVIAACKPEFDDYGVSPEVLNDLQQKWESKLVASRVAQFEDPPPAPVVPQYPPHPHYPPVHHAYPQPPPNIVQPPVKPEQIKPEPADNRYMLNTAHQYSLPPLPGPKLNIPRHHNPGGQTSVLSFPGPPRTIPQVDGPSEDSDDSATPPPPSFAPRALHPSLPQPIASSSSTSTIADSEAINSDLDDSDTEDEDAFDDGGANVDILFCTYDKVARVKSKWKCVLKDGMIHANGKDYLFQRCTCEFNFEF
ncbi:transcription factor IIA alpha/beta subunit [Mycena amicta]|nr:transcription factor IIA alpha/beta subunit [Mycena amicta]